jgi:hypothetical protein
LINKFGWEVQKTKLEKWLAGRDKRKSLGQGADLLENRGWDGLSDRVIEAWYSASS